MTVSPIRYERLFKNLSYATFALAGAGLCWAEGGLIPEIGWIAGIFFVGLIIEYRYEDRFPQSLGLSNVLGVVVALVSATWIAFQFLRPGETVLKTLTFPVNMVPMVGPVLLLLLLAKLVRRRSLEGHWGLQGLALAIVAVGCTLSDDLVFAALLGAYIVSAVWTATVHALIRRSLEAQAETASQPPPLARVLRWSVPVIGIGLVGFFLLPRTEQVWQIPGRQPRGEVGISEEQSLDLNKTGTLELNPDEAFEVQVVDAAGRPKLDIPHDQRWRGPVYRHYSNGSWQRSIPGGRAGPGIVGALPFQQTNAWTGEAVRLPETGRPDQMTLTFEIKDRIGQDPFLFDPIYYAPNDLPPAATLYPSGRLGAWQMDGEGRMRVPEPIIPGRTRYRQVAVPAREPGVSHELNMDRISRTIFAAPPANLANVERFTAELLQRLADGGRIPTKVLSDRDEAGQIKAMYYEPIARVLETYLAASGNYQYTLTLDREDPRVDPVEEFLLNTRAGHCTRFASALAVMLRTQRIPCQVVQGYRGAEAVGKGIYVVRHCYAHTWVEVLAPRTEPAPAHGMFAGRESWHWIMCDPTPIDAAETTSEAGSKWWANGLDFQKLYRTIILNYNPANVADAAEDFWQGAKAAWQSLKKVLAARSRAGLIARFVLAALILLTSATTILVARWLVRRLRRLAWGSGDLSPATALHRRLLRILARGGWKPSPGQTLRELGDVAAHDLAARSSASTANSLLTNLTGLIYRARFGSRPMNAMESAQAEHDLGQLAHLVALRGN